MLARRTLIAAIAAAAARPARAAGVVRIGQATASLSFLPLWSARALGSFAAEGLDLDWAAIPGGDPAALAALDSGDLDLAAVGADTLLAAMAKGQPYRAVGTLMDRVTLDLVASADFMAKRKIAPGDPLPQRLRALDGAVIGVGAVGGAQDRAVRWLATRGGLDPKSMQVALVGGPPALQAALQNGRIDAFVLSPPEGQIAEAGGYGRRLIGMADDFAELRDVPFLLLAAKSPVADPGRIVGTLRALAAADAALLAAPDKVADAIRAKFFPKIDPAIIRAGVAALKPGIAAKGAFGPGGAQAMLDFARQSGVAVGDLTADRLVTSTFIDAALR